MDRRFFIKTAALGAGMVASAASINRLMAATTPGGQGGADAGGGQPSAQTREGNMIYRTLGTTGQRISALGLGGYHIGIPADDVDGIRLIHAAIDRGITFMDNCWDYHNGNSEVRMGKALQDSYRDKVFLMTKIDGRTKSAAAQQIEDSLRRLQTDHIDLMQFHEILRFEDPDRIFAEDGALEAVMDAKKAGKIRFIGFTGHKDPQIHLRMFEIARQHKFHFDAVQMPLNVMDAHFRSFTHLVVPVALAEGTAILGMKPLGSGEILKSGAVKAPECLRFALSLPTSVVITGIQNDRDLDQAIEVARTFKPLDKSEEAALLQRTAALAATGKFEPFKTTTKYDGTAHNPQWLG